MEGITWIISICWPLLFESLALMVIGQISHILAKIKNLKDHNSDFVIGPYLKKQRLEMVINFLYIVLFSYIFARAGVTEAVALFKNDAAGLFVQLVFFWGAGYIIDSFARNVLSKIFGKIEDFIGKLSNIDEDKV
jgi:hypothetical protein